MLIVSKFGGTSMASHKSVLQVARILAQDKARKIGVVSAPGKLEGHQKVTDMLIAGNLEMCLARFMFIVKGLGLCSSMLMHADKKLAELVSMSSQSALLSFGEYMSAYILARLTNRSFIDARDCVFFYKGNVHVKMCWNADDSVILPGFYGYDIHENQIKVFPRGGSDISAAHIAKGVRADLYENWTDVSGVYNKDPQRHPDARKYRYLKYDELARIAEGGAQVFHPDAIAPARIAGIPVLVKNTFDPDDAGTLIL
jgi:aspartate kinase